MSQHDLFRRPPLPQWLEMPSPSCSRFSSACYLGLVLDFAFRSGGLLTLQQHAVPVRETVPRVSFLLGLVLPLPILVFRAVLAIVAYWLSPVNFRTNFFSSRRNVRRKLGMTGLVKQRVWGASASRRMLVHPCLVLSTDTVLPFHKPTLELSGVFQNFPYKHDAHFLFKCVLGIACRSYRWGFLFHYIF